MSTIEETRRANLIVLRDEAGGVGKLADRVGVSLAQLSQWLNGSLDSKTGRPRGMRKESARRIEKSMGRDPGWLDERHDGQPEADDPAPAEDFKETAYTLAKLVQDPKKRDLYLSFLRAVEEYMKQGERIAASIPDIA